MAKLIVLVGLPGSGKTTYGTKLMHEMGDAILLSSDDIRKELYGDPNVIGDKGKVFRVMHSRKRKYLDQGYNVIFDATNLSRKARRNAFGDIPKGTMREIHIVWAPLETCIERDRNRLRTAGEECIMRMVKGFQAPYFDECHKIKLIMNCNHDFDKYRKDCLLNMMIPHDNPHHTFDVYEHSRAAREYAIQREMHDSVRVAALYHDIGKPITKFFRYDEKEKRMVAKFYQHDNVGGWMSYGLTDCNPLVLAWLISNHMQPYFESTYYKELTGILKVLLDELHECDINAH